VLILLTMTTVTSIRMDGWDIVDSYAPLPPYRALSSCVLSLDAKRSSEQSHRQHKYFPNQGQRSVHGNSDKPEWKQQKPHEGIEDECKQC